MAILQALMAALFRSAGKILNTAFGWATLMLFGKVPRKRQMFLSIIALASVLWLAALLGTLHPPLGVFLLTLVSIPSAEWLRLVMMVSAILIPLGVGVLSLFLFDPDQRPRTLAGRLTILLKGYPYTFGMGLTLMMVIIIVPLVKVRDLARRWSSLHIPVVVRDVDYMNVVEDIQRTLRSRGMRVVRRPASWLLRLPTKVLTLFAGGTIDNLVAGKLVTLRARGLEIVLHPSDLVVHGHERAVALASAAIAERLPFSKTYLTWDKEAQEVEDRLYTVLRDSGRRTPEELRKAVARLRAVERDLRRRAIPHAEWEVLFRVKLQAEAHILRAALRAARGTSPRAASPLLGRR